MLFKRYGGAIHEVLSLEYEDFIEQVNYVFDEKSEEDVRNRWINGYQNIGLEEFKQSIQYKKPSEIVTQSKPVEDVLNTLLKNFG